MLTNAHNTRVQYQDSCKWTGFPPHYATSRKVTDSRPDEVNDFFFFNLLIILPAALALGLYLASNRNEYQKHTNKVSGE
jgi:hypothetical protein